MKRVIPLFFLIAIAALSVFVYFNLSGANGPSQLTQTSPRIITPAAAAESKAQAPEAAPQTLDSELYSFNLPLLANETPIQTLQMDINNDGMDDIIAGVKKTGDQAIYCVSFAVDPATGFYTRMSEYRTSVTKSETFMIYAMDVTGERLPTFVCSGINQLNENHMTIFLPPQEKNVKDFKTIADFHSDGAITIMESERSEAYNMGKTVSDSFPICVQSSDPESELAFDQIEKIYQWNRASRVYEQISEQKIHSKKVEAEFLQQLRNGGADNFESFLDGLWYKTDSANNYGIQYILINRREREIIFFDDEVEETYAWESSAATRYGLYITSENKILPSLRRLIDVRLSSADEISVKILEDVKIKISVEPVWNGAYRKMKSNFSESASPAQNGSDESERAILSNYGGENETAWKTAAGASLLIYQNTYIFENIDEPNNPIRGRVTTSLIQGKNVVQFRSNDAKTVEAYVYSISGQTRYDAESPIVLETLELIRAEIDANGVTIPDQNDKIILTRQR